MRRLPLRCAVRPFPESDMMSRRPHLALFAALSFVACKTGGGAPAGKGTSLDPAAKVAVVDGQPVTYGEVESDRDVGPKLRQAEVKALNELYEQRRGIIDEYISRKLLEDEAKSK